MILRNLGAWLVLIGFGIAIQPILTAGAEAAFNHVAIALPDGLLMWMMLTANRVGVVMVGLGAIAMLIGMRHLFNPQYQGPR